MLVFNRLFVHYIVHEGQSIFLLREKTKLDGWDIKKGLRGQYFNDYWLFEFFIRDDCSKINYKLALCSENENNEPIELLRLEEGNVHSLNCSNIENKEKTIIRQIFWNFPNIINEFTNCNMIKDANLNFLSKKTFFCKGYVMNVDGKPVPNVNISCQSSKMKTLTKNDGFFHLEIQEENESKTYFLNICHSNSMPKLKLFSKKEAECNILFIFLSGMEKIQFKSDIDCAKKFETSGVEVEISFKADSFQDKFGNKYQGEVQFSIDYINPMDSNQLETFPTFKSRSQNYRIQHLEVQAAIDIQITGSQNQTLYLNQNAMITIPVIPLDQNSSLYRLDSFSNIWIEQEKNIVVRSGKVSFPIFKGDMYSIDQAIDTQTFGGSLPCWPNQEISGRGLSYNSISRTTTDDKGDFSFEIKKGQNVFFEISRMKNEKMENYGPFNPTLKPNETNLQNKRMSIQEIRESKIFYQSINSKAEKKKEPEWVKEKVLVDVNVLIMNLYPDQYDHAPCNLKQALQEKGISVKLIRKPGVDLMQKLSKCDIFILISSLTAILSDENITDIVKFYENGGSLYIFGDNAPYFVDANRITERLFNLKLDGNDYGDQTVPKLTEMFAGKKTGFDAKCPLFYGLENLYEGNTVSYLVDKRGKNLADQEIFEGFKPILWGTQNNVIMACYNEGNKRCIIDGGFTRLYYQWTSESQRFVLNSISWLSKIN